MRRLIEALGLFAMLGLIVLFVARSAGAI